MVDQEQPTKRSRAWLLIPLLAAVGAVGAILIRLWRRHQVRPPAPARRPVPPTIPTTLQGLTEAEAQARRMEGQDNIVRFEPRRSPRQIVRDNIYTIFNLSLVGVAIVQLLLGQPLDALISFAVSLLNIGLNVGQELLVQRRLYKIEADTRPQAIAIREGRAHGLDPGEIVRGDVLVAGPGDQILVDGELVSEGPLVVDESAFSDGQSRAAKRAGDQIYAGSLCLSGRAAYEAQKVGDERLIAQLVGQAQAPREERTALERTVDRILRILLVIVIVFTATLLLVYARIGTEEQIGLVVSAASVIFNIAPASLFFMIFLTYAGGTVDLAKIGALAHRSRSVESLANATVMCVAQAGILTGTQVDVELIEPAGDQEPVAESRIYQILGDYARSTSMDRPSIRVMIDTFEGTRRMALEEAPFLSVFGWSALAFDDDDLQGVYIIGDPEILEEHLVQTEEEEPAEEIDKEESTGLGALRERITSPFSRLFQRDGDQPPDESGAEDESEPVPLSQKLTAPLGRLFARGQEAPLPAGPEPISSEEGDEGQEREGLQPAEQDAGPKNFFRRFTQRIGHTLRREKAPPEEQETDQELSVEETVYLLAYLPQPVPLHDEDGMPQLPDGLIPLCRLHYSERVRPEALDALRTFSDTGVSIKVFAPRSPDRVIAILEQAGLEIENGIQARAISGPELAGMSPEELALAASEHTIFGHLTGDQAGQVVQALRAQGEAVAMVGHSVSDLAAMRQADLSISPTSGSQATLGTADIVLLENSLPVLLGVLDKGQRIANGLLDVLKLYLTQMFCLALLILIIWQQHWGFPYDSKQGSIINIATQALPSLGLSLWAASGVLPSNHLGRMLARLVGPAAVTLGGTALAVYWFFLSQSGEVAYAQLALTHLLVMGGLLLAIFIRPPWRVRLDGNIREGDWRPTILAGATLTIYLLIASLPIAYHFFLLKHLDHVQEYAVLGLALLAWAIVVNLVWWIVGVIHPAWVPALSALLPGKKTPPAA